MHDIVNNFVRGKNILLVAYDAGGANQIFSLFERVNSYKNARILCDGPAKNIYEKIYRKNYIQESVVTDFLSEVDIVITGTGIGSDLEYNALAMAKKKGIFVVSLLDHWVNYRQRFIRNEIQVLPDEIWVVDNYAKKIVEEIFPQSAIKLVPDKYFENIQAQVNASNSEVKNQALFLLEPIVYEGTRTNTLNPLEILYFENFLSQWKLLQEKDYMTLKLRVHPSESIEKYARYFSSSAIVLSNSTRLSDDLAESRMVFGYHSYAMTVAAKLGKKVFCALPLSVDCKLPQFIDMPRIFHEIL